jgi:hypothetical protein
MTSDLLETLRDAGVDELDLPAVVSAFETAVDAEGIRLAAEHLRAIVERLPAKERVVWLRVLGRDPRPLRESAAEAGVSHVALLKRTRRLHRKVTKPA